MNQIVVGSDRLVTVYVYACKVSISFSDPEGCFELLKPNMFMFVGSHLCE